MIALPLLFAAAIELPALPDGDCFTASFVQTRTLPSLQQPLVLEGRLRIERSGNLVWAIHSPYQYRFASEGETFVETTPDGRERKINAADAPWLRGVQQLFSALLAGNDESLSTWFVPRDIEETADGTQLELLPAESAVARIIERMELRYTERLESVGIDEAGGGQTLIRFSPLSSCDHDRKEQ